MPFLICCARLMFPVLPDTYYVKPSVNAHIPRPIRSLSPVYRHCQLNSARKLVFHFLFVHLLVPRSRTPTVRILRRYRKMVYNGAGDHYTAKEKSCAHASRRGNEPKRNSIIIMHPTSAGERATLDTFDGTKRNGSFKLNCIKCK